MLVIPFPDIHPEIFSFGPFVVDHWSIGPFAMRWYALAYIAGLIIGWRYCLALAQRPPQVARPQDVDDFLVWATLGVVLGGRTGYVLFYNLPYYLQHPIEIFFLWRGGMSFHGGALGVCVAILLFCRLRRIRLLAFADIIVAAVPIGLFFGRIANFINGELWGRPTDVPWAMIFPNDPHAFAAPPEPALRGLSRRHRAVPRALGDAAARRAAAAGPDLRRLPDRLWPGAHHRRVLPRARCAAGIPPRQRQPRPHHGPAAVAAAGDHRALARAARQAAPPRRRERARPPPGAAHPRHRPDHHRRFHGRGAAASAPGLLHDARSPGRGRRFRHRARRSARSSASSSASGAPTPGRRWDGRRGSSSPSSAPAAAR